MIMEYNNNNKKSENNIMEIRLAKITDIDGWMMLVSKVKNSFPGLETAAIKRDRLYERRGR